MNNMNNKNLIINKTEEVQLNKQIIPLFNNPIKLKQLKLRQENKFDLSIINNTENLNKVINLSDILNIFLRGLNLYNLTLNKFLKKENNNKLKLIRELKYDEYKKLNIIYNNYLYLLNRYLPILKIRSLIYSLELFAPKRILKYNYMYTYTFRLRSLFLNKNFNNVINNTKEVNQINLRMLSKILEKGEILNLELNQMINKKKNIINNYKLNNLFLPINNFIVNMINKKSLLEELKLKKEKKNNYDNLLNLNLKKLNLELPFNSIHKNNEINILNTRKSILNYLNFDEKSETLNIKGNNNYSSPVEVMYYKNNLNTFNKPIINQYLKEMSKFNILRKGILFNYNNIIGFNFNSNTNKLIKNIYKLLLASFKSMYCLISKPVFIITPDKISIQLFYYLFLPNYLKLKQIKLYKNNKNLKLFSRRKEIKHKHNIFKKQFSKYRRLKKSKLILFNLNNNPLTKVFSNKFKILCNILSNLFKKPVELNLIRLHYPYFDSNILVNLLGIMINKIRLRIIIRKFFANTVIKNLNNFKNKNINNSIIPAFLTGINIKIAGRLLTQRVVPRKTVKTIIRGVSAKSKVNFLDVATLSNKNRRGAFSITVKSGQNLF
jgi:hypothetical protein